MLDPNLPPSLLSLDLCQFGQIWVVINVKSPLGKWTLALEGKGMKVLLLWIDSCYSILDSIKTLTFNRFFNPLWIEGEWFKSMIDIWLCWVLLDTMLSFLHIFFILNVLLGQNIPKQPTSKTLRTLEEDQMITLATPLNNPQGPKVPYFCPF